MKKRTRGRSILGTGLPILTSSYWTCCKYCEWHAASAGSNSENLGDYDQQRQGGVER